MSKEKKEMKGETYKTLRALYNSGKVKPTLNKIFAELESDSGNIELISLACECLLRTKNLQDLLKYANELIKIAPENAVGYYYKGLAIQHKKGKEQEALKNLNEALALEPENPVFLKTKANIHFLLYTDYHLPPSFAEKHRDKAIASFLKAIEVIEQMEKPGYKDFWTVGEACMLVSRLQDAKRYLMKAVAAYETLDKTEQDKNIYKDIIKAQKDCAKLIDKATTSGDL